MTTLNISVAASQDDCYFYSTAISLTTAYAVVGNYALTSYGAAFRFLNVTVPVGATITAAYITFTSYDNDAVDNCNLNVYGENPTNANPTYYSTSADLTGRTLTSPVAWSAVDHWTLGSTYQTPSLNAIITSIIANANWASGNAMAFQVKENSSSGGAFRLIDQYDNGSGYAVLHIEYTIPTTQIPPLNPYIQLLPQ